MRFFVAVTDNDWFTHLAALKPDEVNFWKPSGGAFKALTGGEPLLFKLHSPQNFIVGGGHFLRYSQLPVSLAWDAFKERNGCSSIDQFRNRIKKYHPENARQLDPVVGCIILVQPFFLERDKWIPIPEDYPLTAVQGKTYSTTTADGVSLWDQVVLALSESSRRFAETANPYDIAQTRLRLGQGAFRIEVTEAYNRRCAVTGERTLPVLQAAHIMPYSMNGPNDVQNGLCLRADLHLLFDQGLVTVTSEHRVEVSPAIKERYENGRDYYAYHGTELAVLPSRQEHLPRSDFLEWHNTEVFVAQ